MIFLIPCEVFISEYIQNIDIFFINKKKHNIFPFRLCSRYDFQHTGAIDYKSFLQRLGIKSTSQTPESLKKGNVIFSNFHNITFSFTAVEYSKTCISNDFKNFEIYVLFVMSYSFYQGKDYVSFFD